VYAELWAGPDGRTPIAIAQERYEDWQAGPHLLQFFFGGLVIRDAGHDGPFLVRNVRFRRVDVEPFDEAEPLPVVGPTPAWAATEFN
jgi:hypothetical protein